MNTFQDKMKATNQSIQSILKEIINSRVEGILVSGDQQIPSPCQEPCSKIKKVLHEEFNTKITEMRLDLQAVTTSLDMRTQSICKEFNAQIRGTLYYIQEVKCWKKSWWWVPKDRCDTEGLL
jgi:hypothetical protein